MLSGPSGALQGVGEQEPQHRELGRMCQLPHHMVHLLEQVFLGEEVERLETGMQQRGEPSGDRAALHLGEVRRGGGHEEDRQGAQQDEHPGDQGAYPRGVA